MYALVLRKEGSFTSNHCTASQNADFKYSGFDRGHLAAAGNHRKCQEHCDETFLLSNMAPQVRILLNYSTVRFNTAPKRTGMSNRLFNLLVRGEIYCQQPVVLVVLSVLGDSKGVEGERRFLNVILRYRLCRNEEKCQGGKLQCRHDNAEL